MKTAMLIPLAILSFSGALAAGSVMTCPNGSQVKAAINQNYSADCATNFCASQGMTPMIQSANSIVFKGAMLQENQGVQIVRCLYSSSNGSLDVALNAKLANAQFTSSNLNECSSRAYNSLPCISADPTACEFQTNTQA